MLARRSFALGLLALMAGWGSSSLAQSPQPTTGDASLKETLVYGLRPRTPADKEFIELVVARVEAKTLPLELVISTYRWALGRRPYPYPFFERGLKQRAKQRGIDL